MFSSLLYVSVSNYCYYYVSHGDDNIKRTWHNVSHITCQISTPSLPVYNFTHISTMGIEEGRIKWRGTCKNTLGTFSK